MTAYTGSAYKNMTNQTQQLGGQCQIYLQVANGNTTNFSNYKIYPQLEKGSTATTYAPYFTPIELAKIGTYQDRIYKDDGKWYVEKQIERLNLNGSENWMLYNTTSLRYAFYINALGRLWGSVTTNLLCNTYLPQASSGDDADMVEYYTCRGTTYNNVIYFMTPREAVTGSSSSELIDSYKTWLSTHPTTVYYPLATPTTTEITNASLIAQLESFISSPLYTGVNNITTVTNNAIPELVIDYITYNKYFRYDKFIYVNQLNKYEGL